MRTKVLWIEDSAKFELSNLMGPALFGGRYDFHLADDVTTAVDFLLVKAFDVILVDIRLPPGIDPFWNDLYQKAGLGKVHDQLGIKFLHWLLAVENSYKHQPPAWVDPTRIGVFTVESLKEIEKKLLELGITHSIQKTAGLPDTTLVDMIEEICPNPQGLD